MSAPGTPRYPGQSDHVGPVVATVERCRQVRWWLLRVPEERTTEQAAYGTQLLQDSPALQAAAGLAWEFNRLVRARNGAALEAWLEQAETSGLPEFAACAESLRRDRAAVAAALRLVWSNGQIEG